MQRRAGARILRMQDACGMYACMREGMQAEIRQANRRYLGRIGGLGLWQQAVGSKTRVAGSGFLNLRGFAHAPTFFPASVRVCATGSKIDD